MTELENLEQREKELTAEASRLHELQATALSERTLVRKHISELRWGVKVGDIVKDHKGLLHRVTLIVPWLDGKPWLDGNPMRKDGTFGTADRHLYNQWELVESKKE